MKRAPARRQASRSISVNSKPPRRRKTSTLRPTKCLQFGNIQQRRFTGFFAVSIEGCGTVGDLKKCIFAQKNLAVIAVLYRGVKLADSRRLSNLIPDLRVGPPRFSVHTKVLPEDTPAVNGIYLNVVNLSGTFFQVALSSLDSTIQELKELIQGHEGMSSIEMISLTSEGKQMNADNATLRDYGLVSGCYVRLVGGLRGGMATLGGRVKVEVPKFKIPYPEPMNFVDVENTKFLVKIPLTKNAPEWRLSVEGLNIEGICTNRKCKACLEMVVCGLGFTAFNIRTEKVLCPICKFSIDPETCGFRKCSWMFEGRKLGLASVDVKSQWMGAGKDYERFDEAAGESTADWQSLVITAKLLRNQKEEQANGDCPICFYSFSIARFPQRVAACGHVFHDRCLTDWERLENTKCPHCTETL